MQERFYAALLAGRVDSILIHKRMLNSCGIELSHS